jgi:hypothetical protein
MTTAEIKRWLTSEYPIWDTIKAMYCPEDVEAELREDPALPQRVLNPKNWKRRVKYKVGSEYHEDMGLLDIDQYTGGSVREFECTAFPEGSQVFALVGFNGKIVHIEYVGG